MPTTAWQVTATSEAGYLCRQSLAHFRYADAQILLYSSAPIPYLLYIYLWIIQRFWKAFLLGYESRGISTHRDSVCDCAMFIHTFSDPCNLICWGATEKQIGELNTVAWFTGALTTHSLKLEGLLGEMPISIWKTCPCLPTIQWFLVRRHAVKIAKPRPVHRKRIFVILSIIFYNRLSGVETIGKRFATQWLRRVSAYNAIQNSQKWPAFQNALHTLGTPSNLYSVKEYRDWPEQLNINDKPPPKFESKLRMTLNSLKYPQFDTSDIWWHIKRQYSQRQ